MSDQEIQWIIQSDKEAQEMLAAMQEDIINDLDLLISEHDLKSLSQPIDIDLSDYDKEFIESLSQPIDIDLTDLLGFNPSDFV